MKSALLLLQAMPRRLKQLVLLAGDILMIPLLLFLALCLRLDSWDHEQLFKPGLYVTAICVGGLALLLSGVYRAVVRAFDEHFLNALMLASCSYAIAMFTLVSAGVLDMPRSTTVVSAFFLFLWVWGSRSLIRAILLQAFDLKHTRTPLLIYGAGNAGRQFLAVALKCSEYKPVAFLDDSRELIGTMVSGLPVFSGVRAAELVRRYDIKDIIIALPSASRARRREVIEGLELLGVHVRALPGLDRLMSGQITMNDVQEIDIADLLGRDAVAPNASLFARNIQGLSVMVSGAGGSIGSELCRQILSAGPRRLILLDLNEYSLYAIDRELRAAWPGVEIVSVLGSVMDQARIERLLRRHEVATVYHAAAYKHVPLVEANPFEGVRNNAIGTYRAACAARAAGVSTFVLISTDKAVRPTNVMGASKRLAELALQALTLSPVAPGRVATQFSMVRFGNVLGSSGSVVPLFRRQIAEGGPLTVTHGEVTRYFMTIPEAAQLVIQAGAMGRGGDVFVLDMGSPVRIVDLARKMIRLSGLTERNDVTPDGDIEIAVTGLRPGEKLYEELLIGDHNIEGTDHPRILRAVERALSLTEMETIFAEIEQLAVIRDTLALKRLLLWYVEGYIPDFTADDVSAELMVPVTSEVTFADGGREAERASGSEAAEQPETARVLNFKLPA